MVKIRDSDKSLEARVIPVTFNGTPITTRPCHNCRPANESHKQNHEAPAAQKKHKNFPWATDVPRLRLRDFTTIVARRIASKSHHNRGAIESERDSTDSLDLPLFRNAGRISVISPVIWNATM